ncbi:MAG: DUF1501 domain-containing protein [Planctomycetaceae bacterium]
MSHFPGIHNLETRWNRRHALAVGGLSLLGLTSYDLAKLRAASAARAEKSGNALPQRARSCVFIFLFGGPSHIDLWDMKPGAPSTVRGEFSPTATNVSGIELSEHLPHLAQQMDKLCLLRSMHHIDPVHGTACSQMTTGRPHRRPGTTDTLAPDDWPSLSALVMRYGSPRGGLPASIVLPWYCMFPEQGKRIAGQSGGVMGEQFNAFLVDSDPSQKDFDVPGVRPLEGVPSDRLSRRRNLLGSIDGGRSKLDGSLANLIDGQYRTAFEMVGGTLASGAFNLQAESPKLREEYGSHKFAQSLLLARRLVEAGTSLVTVNWDDETKYEKQSPFWDTHHDNFGRLKRHLVPKFDRAFATFLRDLADRGLLETTLVCVMGEFGRSPRVGRIVQNNATEATGRDHWPHAFTVLLAGGGVRGGQVYGTTDSQGAYVKDNPVGPGDLAATILEHLGVDRDSNYHAPLLNENHPLSIGSVIRDLG